MIAPRCDCCGKYCKDFSLKESPSVFSMDPPEQYIQCTACESVKYRAADWPREYRAWKKMRQRCSNTSDARYCDYGGRGIAVTERWQSFENFMSDLGPCPNGLSLDRIDNDGDYSPDNCRWATDAQQRRNRRDSVALSHEGKTMIVSEWAKVLGVSEFTIRSRLRRGWSASEALSGSRVKFQRASSTA